MHLRSKEVKQRTACILINSKTTRKWMQMWWGWIFTWNDIHCAISLVIADNGEHSVTIYLTVTSGHFISGILFNSRYLVLYFFRVLTFSKPASLEFLSSCILGSSHALEWENFIALEANSFYINGNRILCIFGMSSRILEFTSSIAVLRSPSCIVQFFR